MPSRFASRQQQFQHLTRPWRERLYGVAMRSTRDNSVAEDWVQETLFRAWKDFNQLAEAAAIYAWLLKILDHVMADDARRDQRRNRIAPILATDDAALHEHPCAAPGPFEQTLQQQNDQQLTVALESLPEEYHRVILLRDIEGLSYREVADVLNLPQGTVMSRLSRGRRLLATALIKQQAHERSLVSHETGKGELK